MYSPGQGAYYSHMTACQRATEGPRIGALGSGKGARPGSQRAEARARGTLQVTEAAASALVVDR